MRMRMACLLLMLGVTVAASAQVTAQALHDEWQSYQKFARDDPGMTASDYFATGAYMGYVRACLDSKDTYLYTFTALTGVHPREIWQLPENATAKQAFAVVGKYLDDHPEDWSGPASLVVATALIAAFPPAP